MPDPIVEVKTNHGTFVITLDPAHAPKSVENFLAYVDAKHYDGTIFHRVINGFMIQGGGYDKNYNPRPTRPPIPHEGSTLMATKGPHNDVGTIAMARTNDPNSATDQFFEP
jgi:peptidyl-prolyl cis-trans isomerase A (cyclophilin A)